MLGLVSHVVDNAEEPNGYVQLNMDRHWKPYGVQREATVESQGRQMYAMVIAYEYSHDQRYLDGLTKAADFLLKMHDDQYGGYYTRVTPELKVLDDTKRNLQEFALFAFANAYRVTKEQKYLTAAMEVFHVFTGKMVVGGIFHEPMKRDFSGPATSPYEKLMHHIDVPDFGPAAPGAGRGGGRGGTPRPHSMGGNIFESFLDLYEATHSKEVWDEIKAQLDVMAETYDDNLKRMAVSDPGISGEGAHTFLAASVFSRAVELGADPKFAEMGSRIVDVGLKTAYNKETGGLGGVDPQGRAQNTFWWSQCEFLKTIGLYAALHGRSDLWPIYDKALSFIKNNYVDTEYGGWYDEMVPGWSRAQLAEWSVRAYVKGAQDANEFDAWHQASMFKALLGLTQPR
jgi:mannose/cellobiose epimerase-like protein (N-acyl-D-glucosamine 2-epimerase family)